MKTTKTTFLIIALFISTNLFSQSWTWQYPYPNANTLKTLYFFDESTGFFGGESGTLLKTTNGGSNLSIINTGNNYNINSIKFVNQSTGFIAGGNNQKIVMKTTNGGSNWTVTNLGTPYVFGDIDFINVNTGMAISSYQDIYYTTNGGTNWVSVIAASAGFYSLDYVTSTLAYATSHGGNIYKSTNGGVNWTPQLIASPSVNLYGIQFIDSLSGYVCGTSGNVLKTTNGGTNWTAVNISGTFTIQSLSFTTSLNGAVVTDNGRYYKTTNGGVNWTVQFPPPANLNALNTVKLFNSGTVYTSGVYGNNMKSTDAGTTWTSLLNGMNTYIFSSYFLNASTGFASMSAGYILKTTNGGTNWTNYLTPTSGNNIVGLQFIDVNTGFAVPVFGYDQILKTTNSGNNWFISVPGINNNVNSLIFLNANTGILTTSYSTFRTTNAGTNWTYVDSIGYSLNGLQFVNSLTGYTSYFNSPNTYFRKTTNGGLNWSSLPGSISNTFAMTYKFLNANTGYAPGNGFMYKTTDAGNNWVQVSSIGITTQSISLLDSISILVGGVFGEVKKSTDGGNSFTSVPFVSQNGITTMSFINSMTGWVMGQGGMIVKTNDILTGNSGFISQTPNSFMLSQNYPNPFNPVTKINYSLPKSGYVSLKIFDILGKEVATLVNEFKTSGNYTIDFAASSYTSGVYFYKLESNNFIEVKKMLLIK